MKLYQKTYENIIKFTTKNYKHKIETCNDTYDL